MDQRTAAFACVSAAALGLLLAGSAGVTAEEAQASRRSERNSPSKPATTSDPGAPNAAERAARLAEGRRRFFEQVQGFDNPSAPPGIAVAPNPADLWPPIIGPKVRR